MHHVFPNVVRILILMMLGHSVHAADLIPVGFGKVEINPGEPVRLMGYASRRFESTNVHSAIHARAVAIGEGSRAAVWIAADNCILPAAVTDEVCRRLRAQHGIPREQIAVSVSHTHNAPSLTGAAPNLFVESLPSEQSHHIERYTRFFVDQLVKAADQALRNRTPARLAWGQGRAGFAANRRTPGGPVDHEVPVLRVTRPDGSLLGLVVNYACHCTTLGDLNQVHPDWTGVCATRLESEDSRITALVVVGCGADSNPSPRGSLSNVEAHGRELADEVRRIRARELQPLRKAPTCRYETIQLPYQPHFTRAQWIARSTNTGIVGFHARKWLGRLDRGEAPPPFLSYPVQTWVFGDDLALVFLGGEVVVDYSLRLKRELKSGAIWMNAYANDVPCYIPSRRILQEGGYEAESSLWYYDRPQQLAPEVEDLIVSTVRRILPPNFLRP